MTRKIRRGEIEGKKKRENLFQILFLDVSRSFVLFEIEKSENLSRIEISRNHQAKGIPFDNVIANL